MEKESYHLIGIGGIGMSSLARLLLAKQKKVSGSDLSSKGLIDQLVKEGAVISLTHQKENITNPSAVIYSSAIGDDNVEMQAAKEKNIPLMHRSELLSSLMEGYRSILVAGSHGKTSTSALLASLLQSAGKDISYSVGGILNQYKTNGYLGSGEIFVAEADESDGSFLNLFGEGGIITNIDEDHLNYWRCKEGYREGFKRFFSNLSNEKLIFWCVDDEGLYELQPKGVKYGFSKEADLQILSYRTHKAVSYFDLSFEGRVFENVQLPFHGRHYALNCAAVFGMALRLGLDEGEIRKGFIAFEGVQRRMTFVSESQRVKFYEDYAHHPSEIEATLRAFRDTHEERRIVVLFQPHRYTRTRDFLKGFTSCFGEADHLFLLDVYPAGEKPVKGGTTKDLVEELRKEGKVPFTHIDANEIDKVVNYIRPHDRVIAFGAGNINEICHKIADGFAEKQKKLKVALIFGGKSREHEIAKISAEFISRNLDPALYDVSYFYVSKNGEWSITSAVGEDGAFVNEKVPYEVLSRLMDVDVALPIFHGPNGEDGTISAFLETLGIAHTGCDHGSSAICMNKIQTKKMAYYHGVPMGPFLGVKLCEWKRNRKEVIAELIEKNFFPLFVKPVHQGSSIGISYVESFVDFEKSVDAAFQYDEEVIIEKKIICRELEFGVMGNDYVHVSYPGEILTGGKFYSYEAKYGKGGMKATKKSAVSEKVAREGRELAKRAYVACGCKGMARVDFFLGENNEYFFNEINPIPGLTSISLFPLMMENYGWKAQEMVDRLVFLALHAKRLRDRV